MPVYGCNSPHSLHQSFRQSSLGRFIYQGNPAFIYGCARVLALFPHSLTLAVAMSEDVPNQPCEKRCACVYHSRCVSVARWCSKHNMTNKYIIDIIGNLPYTRQKSTPGAKPCKIPMQSPVKASLPPPLHGPDCRSGSSSSTIPMCLAWGVCGVRKT